MKPRHKRLALIGGIVAAVGVAAALVLNAFNDNLVFFYSPTDLRTKHVPVDRQLRIGGLVEEKSVVREGDGRTVEFRVTDGNNTVNVSYTGTLPDLFREGQGVVAEGKMTANGSFKASSVLAKHDEKYMPPEVADALKRSGHWQEGSGGPVKAQAVKTGATTQ